jgi:hypothetical protein
VADSEREARRACSRVGGRRWVVSGILFAAAAGWFAISARLTLEWIDEGQIVYPIWRTAAGAVPYREFGHAYWPALFVTNGLLLRVFGEDLAVLRAGLVVLKAVTALAVYYLARELARPWIALVAWSVLLAVWGAPLWLFNTPYANHYALTLGLLAALVLLDARPRSPIPAACAGLLVGVAATFKHTTGAFVALAGLSFLASELRPSGARRPVRGATLGGAALVVLLYASRSPHGWSTALLVAPVLASLARLAYGEQGGSRRLSDLGAFCVGAGTPVLACILLAAWLGVLPALIRDTLTGLGVHMTWGAPLPAPGVVLVTTVATLAAGSLAVVWWRRGRSALAAAATVSAAAGVTWIWAVHRTPVPMMLHWLPVLATTLAVVAWWAGAPDTLGADARGRAFRLLVLFAAFTLLNLHPGADLPHALMILPAVLPLAAWLADQLVDAPRAPIARTLPAATLVAIAAGVVEYPFVATLWRTLEMGAQGAPRFARASGIRPRGRRAANVAELLQRLDALSPPGSPIVVLPNAQMIYFLADRPSAIEHDEFALYLLAAGIVSPAAAPALVDENALVRRLETRRPIVVVDRTEPMLGRLREALPALARFLDTRCEPAGAIGSYAICRIPPEPGSVP